MSLYRTNGPLVIVVVIPGHNLGNSQVSVYRTIGPTLGFFYINFFFLNLAVFYIGENKKSQK